MNWTASLMRRIGCVLCIGVVFVFLFSTSYASLNLTISLQNTNNVTVSWLATGAYVLQTNSDLVAGGWGDYSGVISINNGTNSVTIGPQATVEFFRLTGIVGSTITSPANISGLAYFWNYNDLPNAPVNAWTDEISGVVLSADGSNWPSNYLSQTPITNAWAFANAYGPGMTGYPYDIIPGVLFFGTQMALTNTITMASSNFTVWMVIRPQLTNVGTEVVLGNGGGNGIVIATNLLAGDWPGQNYSSMAMNYTNQPQFGYGQTYDIVDAGGTIYSNGTAIATGVSQPTNNFSFSGIGTMAQAPMAPFQGTIQYLGIWTNTLLTAADASNLDVWYWNYGVTNVTNGLIGWWPMNQSSGTVVTDVWSTNHFYWGGTGDGWVNNGIVNGGGLSFGGSGWATNLSTNFADNLPAMTISFWVQSSILDNANSDLGVVEKGNGATKNGMNPGWGISSDSITNVYFGCYEGGDDPLMQYVETIHGYVDGPIKIFPVVGDGNWHFIVGTYTNARPDAGIMPVIYIDGAQQPATYLYNTIPDFLPVTNISCAYPISIGQGYNSGYSDNGLVGTMDDLRIYNRQLTMQEVYDLYKWRGQP